MIRSTDYSLMEQVGCIPVAYYNDFWLQSEKITGIWHSAYGFWDFMYGDRQSNLWI